MLLVDERVLNNLKDKKDPTKVDLSVYRRLKDDGIIKGELIDVSNVKPFTGDIF